MPEADIDVQAELRTFLIADVRGYTRFTVEYGDEAAARLAGTFARLAREAATAHGGQVIELRGDEALAVFSSARQALRAAIDLQTRCVATERADPSLPLRVGVGIDAGEAVRVEDGYRGAALNLAARLCSIAGPREVLASEGVVHLARRTPGLIYAERGLVELKGFVEPIRVIQVLSETDTFEDAMADSSEAHAIAEQPAPPIGSFLGALPPSPLAGREDDVERLLPLIDAAELGSGQLVMLAGEAGVGRTRLAQELAVITRDRGFLVATGRCYQSERDVPLFPFLEAIGAVYRAAPAAIRARVARQWPALGRILPEQMGSPVAQETEDQEDGKRLFRAVAGFLTATSEQCPIALLLDDLHWADEGSLRLLQHLARQTRAQRILLVGTYRDADLERDGSLDRVMRELSRERLVDRLTLHRLPPEGTAAMVSNTVGDMEAAEDFAEFVHRRAKGKPYYIEEMLRTLGGRYRLVKLVGAGGMGRVFQAVDTRTGRVVAAKILFASSEADLDALLRFQQEGAVLSTLKHANIVEVYGTFLEEHTSCIIMELLDGRSLHQILQEEQLDLARIKNIARQAATALAYAHTKSIVHRDVKPDNIMVLSDDRVKVTDFGIARILRPGGTLNTMTGMTLGTPLYMAPEQIEGGQVDGRADVYSLGAVLYQALAGRPPFEGDDPMTVAFRQVHDAPEPPSRVQPGVPPDWEAVILKALAKKPVERYSTAAALERAIAALSVGAAPAEGVTAQIPEVAPSRAPLRILTPPPTAQSAQEAATADDSRHGMAARPRPVSVIKLGTQITARLRLRFLLALPALAITGLIAFLLVLALAPGPAVSLMGLPVAGWSIHTTSTTFNFPADVAVDAAGTIYVADEYNNRIVRLSADGTPLAPWGLSASGRFNHPAALAVDGQGDVFVVDTGDNRIEEMAPDGAVLNHWDTAGTASLRDLGGIAVDRQGTLYIADSRNDRIVVQSKNGSTRQWPAPNGQGLTGVALDSRGNVYVADQGNNVIDKFSSKGRFLLHIGRPGVGTGELNGPRGLAVDASDEILVADSGNRRIERFSTTGKSLPWTGTPGHLSSPFGLAVDRAGNLYVADAGGNTIQKLSATGKPLASWTGAAPRGSLLDTPAGVAVDDTGNIYVADTRHHRIVKAGPDGGLLAAWGTSGSRPGQFQGPFGIAVDAAGSVYVADTGNNRIQKLSRDGQTATRGAVLGTGELAAPWGLTLDRHGNIYVADTGNGRIQVLSPAGAPVRSWGSSGPGPGQFSSPSSVAVAPNGTAYVADQGNNRIGAFNAHGRYLFAWDRSSAGQFSGPQGVAVDSHGSVYVADTGNNRVEELSPQGKLLALVAHAGLSGPIGVAVDAHGDVYVSDTGDNRVIKIAPRG